METSTPSTLLSELLYTLCFYSRGSLLCMRQGSESAKRKREVGDFEIFGWFATDKYVQYSFKLGHLVTFLGCSCVS